MSAVKKKIDIYKDFGVERPSEKRWDPMDPRAEPLEELRIKADVAEAARMAALWQMDPAEALRKEQEKVDRDIEVAAMIEAQGGLGRMRQPKNVITPEEMAEVTKLSETDPVAAKAAMQQLRRKEIEAFQSEKKGAKFGYGNEVMCDNCKSFHLVIQRCARCKLAWYCSRHCQAADWPTHRHVCAAEEIKRLKAESAPATPREGEEGAGDKKKKKKKKTPKPIAAGSQDPKELDPDMEELALAQEEMLGRKINRLTLSRFRDKERHAYEHLMSAQMRDVIESMWKSFHLAGLVPLDEPGKARTVREIWKYAGAKPEFMFLAKRGEEWVGKYTKDHSSPLDKKVSAWLRRCVKEGRYKLDDQERMDYQTFVRLLCARRLDHHMGN